MRSEIVMVMGVCALLGCGSSERSSGQSSAANTPTAAPTPPPVEPLPEHVEVNQARAELGRRLFHDPGLSGDGTISCASCHSLDKGGADGAPSSTGIHGQIGPINSPTVLNAVFNFKQFWDGRAADLEEQAGGPIGNPKEMGSSLEAAVAYLSGKPDYVAAFSAAYPDGVNDVNLRDAIAEYERMLVTPGRFDRFLRGDQAALTADERAGWELFQSTGCTACHQGQNLGGTMFQKFGLVRDYLSARGTPLTDADNGRWNVTHQDSDRYFFKVPTLRNVELTAPYFHDASATTLERAVEIMARHQLGKELQPAEIGKIVAFLKSLTGELPAGARMPSAPTEAAPTAPPGEAPAEAPPEAPPGPPPAAPPSTGS